MNSDDQNAVIVLRCAECGGKSDEGAGAQGWHAFIIRNEANGQAVGVEVFCLECAETEFGKT